ncbi:MAG: hypothetical protein QME51_06620, partial [Planctomycetota bacterium]|nr:hypothetical protein [Planctomycetota bacterium]
MAVTQDRIDRILQDLRYRPHTLQVTPEEYDVVSSKIRGRPEARDWGRALRQGLVGGKTTEQLQAEQKETQQLQQQQQMKSTLDQYLPGMYDSIGNIKVANRGFWAVYDEYAEAMGKPASTGGEAFVDPEIAKMMSQTGGVDYVNEATTQFREFRHDVRKAKRKQKLQEIVGIASIPIGGALGGMGTRGAAAGTIATGIRIAAPEIALPAAAILAGMASLPKDVP